MPDGKIKTSLSGFPSFQKLQNNPHKLLQSLLANVSFARRIRREVVFLEVLFITFLKTARCVKLTVRLGNEADSC